MTDVFSRHYDHYDYLAEKREAMVYWCAEMDARGMKKPLQQKR
jgi:hypothetical protein